MSSFKVIRETSETLRRFLLQAFRGDPEISSFTTSEDAIAFANPTETARNPSHQLSLWLYQVTENEFVKNQPRERANGGLSIRKAPLAINLYFLVTPFAASRERDYLLLGKTMQALYDNAVIPLQNGGEGVNEELHITLCRLSLEELTRIWEALREPYRLSVCYQVRINRIESRRQDTTEVVLEGQRSYRDMDAIEGAAS